MSFKRLADHLLDLGKRNRLLNYKEKGYKGISVLVLDINTLYHNIVDSREYKILPLEPILNRQRNLTTAPNEEVSSYPRGRVLDIVSPILKKNEIICYKEGYSQARVLRALYKEYKFSINEKGINTLYIAFGFVKYEDNKASYKAPLLLIPLEYKRLNSGYSIKEREDEIYLNPTLFYYFKESFNINIPYIESEDESLASYFSRVKAVLAPNMELIEDVEIGIFSFLKMNMYDDLVNNEALITQNKNIKALVYKENIGLNSNLSYRLYPVKDHDSSQLEAIELAAKGESFVLEGPPGSGKSQTITNIIATLIGNGRKVLFVSEKLAALEVVYNNLKKVGLSDFALEIHSAKANKKDVIESIYKTANKPRYDASSKCDDEIEAYRGYKDYLDEYLRVLHKPISNDRLSTYDLICEYLKLDECNINYKINNISNIAMPKANEIANALNDYSIAIKPLGYSYRDLIFSMLINLSYEYVSYEINDLIYSAMLYLHKLNELRDKLNKYINVGITSINSLYKAIDFIDRLNRLKIKSNAYFNKKNRGLLIDSINQYEANIKKLPNISMYDKEILDLDLKPIYRYMKGSKSGFSRLFDKEYKKNKRLVLSYRNGKAKYDELINELASLINYKEAKSLCNQAIINIKSIINSNNISDIKLDLELTKGFIGYEIDFSDANFLTDALIAFKSYYSEDISLNKLASNIDSTILDVYNADLALVYSRIKELYLKKDSIKEYYLVKESLNRLKALDGLAFLNSYLENGMELDKIATSYKSCYLKNRILYEFSLSPLLSGFNQEQFNEKVEEFQKLDKKMLNINRDLIIANNSSKRPDDLIMGGAYSLLAHENSKLKRKMPIRMLFDKIFEFILDIKPVLLMSPLSVSTYLSSKIDMFDCVVFDEASQIFAWDALGAIYRSRQCIIIGDSKQMPPSSFFFASVADDSDDYTDDINDQESILDMASEALPSASLKWHYRSRAEELIEFSNEHFYNHSLITIPEADSRASGLGIDFVYLPNGRYDMKTRTNLVEANKICDMVIDHVRSSHQSLGVVAFSEVQAELIEEILEERIANDKSLSKYFDENVEEPFFIKNLETVQGDERDRIIFSICYGYNNDGKFYQRFGPLNLLGGERRLNVAITRAKYNISIVSSIRYTDIKPSEALGCILLHDYLKFAENVKARTNSSDTDNGLILSVKQFLEENGYNVVVNYGASAFKIDLAVKNSLGDKFIAAIICDSTSDLKHNTTELNRLEKSLIERQGWAYYKIYAPAWLSFRELSESNLLNFLSKCGTKLDNESNDNIINDNESYLKVNKEITTVEDQFKSYIRLDNKLALSILSSMGVDQMLYKIIELEAPITRGYLYKRVSEILGKKSVTNMIRNLVDKNIPAGVLLKSDTFWINYEDISPLRLDSSRAIDEIPLEELMDGIRGIVHEAIAINKIDCYRRLNQCLGFKRLTEANRGRLDSAVVFLGLSGEITINGEKLSI